MYSNSRSEFEFTETFLHILEQSANESYNYANDSNTRGFTHSYRICFLQLSLKNSGSASSDVKVSYIDSDDKEILIENQSDFQLALYAFRKRARVGEIITLNLENLVDCRKKIYQKKKKCANDIEVQTYINEEEMKNNDVTPDWFINYMKKFKRDLLDEILLLHHTSCKSLVSHQCRKNKIDSYKKSRKPSIHTPVDATKSSFERDLYKQVKLENKLENKLEKLEQKSMKIRAKKLSMKVSTENDVRRYNTSSRWQNVCDSEFLMNATAVNSHETNVPHMLGGETYVQNWEVINSGKIPWTAETELRFAWGSELLNTKNKTVSCPPLKPGEKGIVSVVLQVPEKSGNYECYWHFHHFGRRFGHWLGCQVIVDAQVKPIRTSPKLIDKKEETLKETKEECLKQLWIKLETETESNSESVRNDLVIIEKLQNLKIESEIQSNEHLNNSDIDNISVISLSRSNSASNSDYIVISNTHDSDLPLNYISNADILELKNITEDIQTQKSQETIEKEVIVAEDEEYAYIYYKGEKIPFHKTYLTKEYFNRAEKVNNIEENCQSLYANNFTSQNSKRMFVFPQHSPGFEVYNLTKTESIEGKPYFPVSEICGFSNYESNFMSHSHSEMNTSCNNFDFTCNNHGDVNDTKSDYMDSYSSLPLSVSLNNFTDNISPIATNTTSVQIESSLTDKQVLYKTSPFTKVKMITSSTYSTPQMTESVNNRRQKQTPDNILSEAAIFASSAMSSARNMVNMVIKNEAGKWINGHWVAEDPNTKREYGLKVLSEMGFHNRDINATLLARFNDDIQRVVSELIQ